MGKVAEKLRAVVRPGHATTHRGEKSAPVHSPIIGIERVVAAIILAEQILQELAKQTDVATARRLCAQIRVTWARFYATWIDCGPLEGDLTRRLEFGINRGMALMREISNPPAQIEGYIENCAFRIALIHCLIVEGPDKVDEMWKSRIARGDTRTGLALSAEKDRRHKHLRSPRRDLAPREVGKAIVDQQRLGVDSIWEKST